MTDHIDIARRCSSTAAVAKVGEDFLHRFACAIIDEVAQEFEEPYDTYANKWVVDHIRGLIKHDY